MLPEADAGKQFLFLIRHGDRYDYAHPKVKTIDGASSLPNESTMLNLSLSLMLTVA